MEMIGAYEAKTHLAKLLERVERGERLTITRHGRPVAQLIPVLSDRQQARQAAARIVQRRRHSRKRPWRNLWPPFTRGTGIDIDRCRQLRIPRMVSGR